jgi:hypothetical protein
MTESIISILTFYDIWELKNLLTLKKKVSLFLEKFWKTPIGKNVF